ncbi:hypothetical protein BC936DRAFT_144006 [Jimgerdemannia flammicorona]|uniref:Uncharacterized protein n=1 Tax=Jimgerdemannia flammicorona TaxID=994334 RepID=A0A433DD80_9FUNG|nr:hypothetical protein BC936DRAFT_144006 [Jimgerdemannia flammicorona]
MHGKNEVDALPPFGHSQNQPYFWFSIASKKCLQTISVVVRGLPCLDRTTSSSFDWSHLSMVSERAKMKVIWHREDRLKRLIEMDSKSPYYQSFLPSYCSEI